MRHLTPRPFAAAGVAVALACGLFACSEPTTTAPQLNASVLNDVPGVVSGTVVVCKDATSPAGTYNFTVAQSPTGHGTLSASPFTVDAGSCVTVFTADGGDETVVTVTVTEVNQPAGTQFDSVGVTGGIGSPTITGAIASTAINTYHGAVLDYFDSAVPTAGCTLTQGFWKNHSDWPAGYDPSDAFFGSGWTWQEVLDTSPKGGNSYLILAHQYIAAILNQASGASVPTDVQDALDAATTFFTNAGSNTYVKDNTLNDWASTLDDYNNGLTGPGHCSD